MRTLAKYPCRAILFCGAGLLFSGAAGNLIAQDAGAQAQAQTEARADIANFDAFLDAHTDIDAQLRANPALLNSREFLESHPELRAFLDEHPRIREEARQNSDLLVRRQNRFDTREQRESRNGRDFDADRGHRGNPNPDLTQQEVAAMDRFLDSHPDVERDLQRNPNLVNDNAYLRTQHDLDAFLDAHPAVKNELKETPTYFMRREQRFEGTERDRDMDRNRTGRRNPNPDLTQGEVAAMDRFLDSHPDVERDLRRNPDLVNDNAYLRTQHDLDAFLDAHPAVKDELKETPTYFMRREQRFEGSDRDRAIDSERAGVRNSGRVSSQEASALDQFLDRHEDVAKSLEKKPELINDRGYLKRHKDLDEFLQEHPALRAEARENASVVVRGGARLEARNMDRDELSERDRDRDRDNRRGDIDRDRRGDVDRDMDKKEVQELDHFLDKHKSIDKDLEKNPSLISDNDYLRHHKSLESFLRKNPDVGVELKNNPSTLMHRQERMQRHQHNEMKDKTRLEKKEQTHTPTTPH